MHFETDRPAFEFRQGTAPLLISFPHVGTYVPPALAERFTPDSAISTSTERRPARLRWKVRVTSSSICFQAASEMGASSR